MISKTAQADVEEMWEAGLKPSFADIIRINAVALGVERATGEFALSALPRVAFIGDVAFREPTVGSEIWLAQAQRLFDQESSETFIILRAFSLSKPQSELPDPVDEKAVLAAVKDFKTSLAFATVGQILSAIGYAVHGFDQASGEHPAQKPDAQEPGAAQQEQSYDIGLMRKGMIYRLGSAADLKELTPSALRAMLMRAIARDHEANVAKDAVAMAEDDYLRTLDEITDRLKKELGNG